MKASRLFVATAVAVAALALTACDPDDTSGGAGTAGSAAPSTAATSTTSAAPSAQPTASAKPGSAKPSPAKSGGATPKADCTAQASSVGHVVEATENGYLTSVWMRAKATKFVCGPDVPNDGYFEGYGAPAVYTFSNDVKTTLLVGSTGKPVDLDTFMKHMDDCLKNPTAVAAPYNCYGNQYVIKADGKNVITSISELYHP
ncbi:hypothetical protein OG871_28975 [Kitasatospora sp. NBC_00374]|uniref:hypothetical protein n=1 Tax=Kitasatospora sp. NBC_00374 TaxID=2975964 RepID=UPI00324697F5